MLVATSVVTDTRVLREASTLAADGHSVHIIGKDVPPDFDPPMGITVSSVGATSGLRAEGSDSLGSSGSLPVHLRAARWLLLPQHRNKVFESWAHGAVEQGRSRGYDVVHAHDFTALAAGAELAALAGVPYVYDTHELWSGRPREYRPTPYQDARERRAERELGAGAATVITVGQGVADELRRRFGWHRVRVVRNTFPLAAGEPKLPNPAAPEGLLYAGRLAPYRDLETLGLAAARLLPLRVTAIGPADQAWLSGAGPGMRAAGVDIREPVSSDEVSGLYRELGLALVSHSDRWANHRLAMPNKLFHAVAAGVPVVGTDVPELRRVITDYGIGTVYTYGDEASLVAAVREALDRYPEFVAAVRAARPALSWEADAVVLREVYAHLT